MLIRMAGREMRPHYSDDTGAPSGGTVQVADPPASDADRVPADDFDKDRAMATIKQLRAFEKDAKAKIKRLEEIEAAEEARKSADLSELEKTRKQLATLQADHERTQAALRAARIKDAARAAALSLSLAFQPGALDDAVALGLFADLEIDADGKVRGLNDLLKGLQKDRPYLFGTAPIAPEINAGARGNGARTAQDVITAEAERLRRSGRYGGF